jgi:hypothetical protein
MACSAGGAATPACAPRSLGVRTYKKGQSPRPLALPPPPSLATPRALVPCVPRRHLQSAATALGAKLRRAIPPDEVAAGASCRCRKLQDGGPHLPRRSPSPAEHWNAAASGALRPPHKRAEPPLRRRPSAPPAAPAARAAACVAHGRSQCCRVEPGAGVDPQFRLCRPPPEVSPPTVFVSIPSIRFVPQSSPSMPGAPVPIATRATAALSWCSCARDQRKKMKILFCD